MHRWLLFVEPHFECDGGWYDFRGSFSTQAEIEQSLASEDCSSGRAHVVDATLGEIVQKWTKEWGEAWARQ